MKMSNECQTNGEEKSLIGTPLYRRSLRDFHLLKNLLSNIDLDSEILHSIEALQVDGSLHLDLQRFAFSTRS